MTRFALCLLATGLFAVPCHAQTSTGGISGTVRDASGAVVPQAKTAVLNLDTGEGRSQLTSTEGSFTFPAVQPGRYRVEVEAAGFKRVTQEPVEVNIQTFVTVNPSLQIGNVVEVLEVRSAAPLVESTTSSLGQVVQNQQIVQLPVKGRNTLAFVALTPGVRIQGGFGEHPATVNFQAWGNFSANDGVSGANEVLVDGRRLPPSCSTESPMCLPWTQLRSLTSRRTTFRRSLEELEEPSSKSSLAPTNSTARFTSFSATMLWTQTTSF